MKKSLSIAARAAATAAVLITATACTTNPSDSDSTVLSNKDKAVAVLNSIETGDQQAVSYINPTQYTQHNLAVGDGLAGFGAVLQALPKDSAKVDVVRAFSDGDYVFSHTDYNFFGPKVGFDIFRFENGLIVEHWDNLAVKAENANPSGRTQLDGTTVIADLDKTEENKALVADFVDTILVKGEMDKISNFIEGDNYLQHNTDIADGISGLGAALQALAEKGIFMVYSENHIVLGEGNFVLSVSEGTFADAPTSFYDLFRVEGGKIVEHWDVIETIPAQDEWKNSNGKFGNL
jgi:predicted SnoaL-like aldol condensation-catalyzing enzyme